jgi:thymidylate synthase
MHYFEGSSLDGLYLEALKAVRSTNVEIQKEGRRIKELYSVAFKLCNPREGILCVAGRPYSPAFAVAEMLWNLAADTSDWLCSYNKKYAQYFTDGRLLGGYGARLMKWSGRVNQVDKAITLLSRLPHSQHANLIIFDPTVDLDEPKFVPCITMIKLRIRRGRLQFSSFLRAQDLWLGFPYDVFLLLNLFQLLSIELGVEMGDYYHYCDVLRLYQENFTDVERELHAAPSVASRSIALAHDKEEIREKLLFYRDLVRDRPRNMVDIALAQPPYWRDCLLACWVHSRLRRGEICEAAQATRLIGNVFKEQVKIWSSRYWPRLHAALDPVSE